jgi:hypothetical protein
MIRQRPQPTPAIIKVKASGELRHEEFNNIVALIKVAVGSQGKCHLRIVVGVSHRWDGEPCGIAPRSFHPCLSRQDANRTRPTGVDDVAKYGSLRAALVALVDKEPGAMPESRRKDDMKTRVLPTPWNASSYHGRMLLNKSRKPGKD